jgi:hypothetical protein
MLFASIFTFLVPIVFSAMGLGVALTLLWHKRKEAAARTIALEHLAQALQLTFSAKDTFGLTQQLHGFDLFKRERSRWLNKGKVTNVMRGWVGETEVYLFDYSYSVQAGKSRKIVTRTVFFANDKQWFLPNFHLKPERWWHKLQAKLGIDKDINFEENPDFSDKFWLKSEFEGLVREQFTPALRGFLSERPPAQLEGSNYYLIGYKHRRKMDAMESRFFFQHCCEIVQLLQENGKLELLDLAELKREAVVLENGDGQKQS